MGSIRDVRQVEIRWDDGAAASMDYESLDEIGFLIGDGRGLPDDPLWTRKEEAQTEGSALFSGLGQLPPKDIVYAAKGRALANELGATPGEIAAIVDRASAASYITGTSFWTSMTAGERQRWVADTDSWVRILVPLVALVREIT